MPFGSLSNVLEIKSAEGFRGSSVLQQSYPLTGYAVGAAAPVVFTPASLFAAGEQGVWYDPSDLTTMFTDAAGTTPVGTPGNGSAQPVGKILDKSGRGNHATQSTASARPTLSAKYNLLTYTEQFDNAAWTKINVSITADSTTSPVGTSTADSLLETSANGYHATYYYTAAATAANGFAYTFLCYVKANGRTKGYLSVVNGGGYVTFDLSAVTISFGGNGTNETVTGQTITDVGSGWYRLTMTSSFTGTANITPTIGAGDASGNFSYTGDPTKGLYVWGADVRSTTDGVGLPVYQRVADSLTYDAVNFPYYIAGNGVDRFLATTNNLDLTGTNKLGLFWGVRKLTDVNLQIFVEFSAISDITAGTFINYQYTSSTLYAWDAWGTLPRPTEVSTSSSAYAAPVTNVFTGLADISAPSRTMRINGSQVSTLSTSMGTGNFSSQKLYLLSRAGINYFCNARMYGLILRGTASTATEISNTETWLNGKTKAY